MEFVLELILEIIIEGTLEGVTSKKVILPLRMLFLLILLLIYGVIMGSIAMAGIGNLQEGNVSIAIIIFVIDVLIALLLVYAIVKKYLEKRKNKRDNRNPWTEIELADYENHMKLYSVMQLQTLSDMMKKQFEHYPVKTAMVLGVAGGNGLEHIDARKFQKVYGVDINQKYLEECNRRYGYLRDVVEFVCVDLTSGSSKLPQAELIIANLLIEYIGYECFQKTVKKVEPQYVSCIIQVNEGEGFVSDSPYIHAFDDLESVHHQIKEDELVATMEKIGYKLSDKDIQALPNGKSLVQLDFMLKV